MGKVSTGHAKQLVYNYEKRDLGKGAKGVWFPKDVILEALNTPVRGIMPTGLRFYFAKYEKYQGDGHVTRVPKYPKESSKKTLVIVPTIFKDDEHGNPIMHPWRNEKLPFDLLDEPGQGRKYDPLPIEFAEQNDGQICPPPPPPAVE